MDGKIVRHEADGGSDELVTSSETMRYQVGDPDRGLTQTTPHLEGMASHSAPHLMEGQKGIHESCTVEYNKSIISLYLVNEAYNRGNLFALDECVAPHYVDHRLWEESQGIDWLKDRITELHRAFPDLYINVLMMIVDRERVAWHWEAKGTHNGVLMGMRPTGKSVYVMGTSLVRLAGGQIVEAWNNPDAVYFKQWLDNQTSQAGSPRPRRGDIYSPAGIVH